MSDQIPEQPIFEPVIMPDGGSVENTPHVGDPERYSRFVTGIIMVVVLILLVGGVLAVTAPATFSALINAFWMVVFCTVLLFLILGVLIMVGLKNQVKQILDIFVEGGLSIVDVMNFLKMAATFILDVLKQAIYFLVPFVAYLLGAAIYVGLMYLYKWVGKSYDVTLFTIGLAAVLVVATGFLNRKSKDEGKSDISWGKKVQLRFQDMFGDAVEVVLFIFFMTMDSTNLFFLPKDLNVQLHALQNIPGVGPYDFMVRGWTLDSTLKTTLTIVMIAVGIEILRYIVKIIAAGFEFYREINTYVGETNQNMPGSAQIKWSLRQSFEVHKDDVIGFITYMTFLIFVFLAFPRLKILAMAVASLTSLLLDFFMRDRLVITKSNDLFSKLVSALFRV